jgi:hypothetical protein
MVRLRPAGAGANFSIGANPRSGGGGATSSEAVAVMGDVRLLASIPFFSYGSEPDLLERMQQTETSDSPGVHDDLIVPKCIGGGGGGGGKRRRPASSSSAALNPNCYDYGDGDELITPVYIGPKDVGGVASSSTASPSGIEQEILCPISTVELIMKLPPISLYCNSSPSRDSSVPIQYCTVQYSTLYCTVYRICM